MYTQSSYDSVQIAHIPYNSMQTTSTVTAVIKRVLYCEVWNWIPALLKFMKFQILFHDPKSSPTRTPHTWHLTVDAQAYGKIPGFPS